MSTKTRDGAPNSIDVEPQADLATKPNGKSDAETQAPRLDAWSARVLAGTAKMAIDEAFRRSIASRLSAHLTALWLVAQMP